MASERGTGTRARGLAAAQAQHSVHKHGFDTRGRPVGIFEGPAIDDAHRIGNTPAQFGEVLRADMARWSQAVRIAGLKLD